MDGPFLLTYQCACVHYGNKLLPAPNIFPMPNRDPPALSTFALKLLCVKSASSSNKNSAEKFGTRVFSIALSVVICALNKLKYQIDKFMMVMRMSNLC